MTNHTVTEALATALERIKLHCTSLADAQVIALEALDAYRAQEAAPAAAEGPTDFQLDQLFDAVHEFGEFGREFRERAREILAAHPQPAQGEGEAVALMTHNRARFFMERFLHEEKMLGPNEQAALRHVIALLEAAPPAAGMAGQGLVALDDKALADLAYKGYDDYWTEGCGGEQSEAWVSSAKAVLAAYGIHPASDKPASEGASS